MTNARTVPEEIARVCLHHQIFDFQTLQGTAKSTLATAALNADPVGIRNSFSIVAADPHI